MNKYNCIDMFSGAGGLSAGFADADFNISAAIDHIGVFLKTHHENFPASLSLQADISSLPASEFSMKTGLKPGDINVIIGSPPCQTFSTIGTPKIRSIRKGDIESDPRNYLFKYFFEYIKFYRPSIFLMENVPTMIKKYEGKLFKSLLDLISSLGYDPHYKIINSAEHGVPQIRNRLFLVGTLPGFNFSFPKATHYMPANNGQFGLFDESDQPTLKKATTAFDALADLPIIYDGCREDRLPYSKKTGLAEYQILMRNGNDEVRNNICRISNERAKKIFSFMKQGDRYMDLPEDIRKILPFREDIFPDRLKRLDSSKPSWTVLAHIGMDGYMYIHPTEDRTLSVREAARLQGFHDSFIFYGNMREQYIQVGNAVPPLLSKQIARSIKSSLR